MQYSVFFHVICPYMSVTEQKLKQASDCFQNGDSKLGMRRLIDCALDTQDVTQFKSTLELISFSEQTKDEQELMRRTSALLEQLGKHQPKSHKPATGPLLKATELSKQYKRSQFRISPVNFSLHYGQVIGLVGENGNGKTTLLRLLAGDLLPDSGSIDYDVYTKTKHPFELRSRLIYIPQRIPRWFGTLMDNLQFTLAQHGIKGEDNLLWVEMMIARLGLRPYKHLGWNRISSGYRTRFELAKSLLRRPDLMLLDEPLSNLDIISQQTILQDLKFLSESASSPFGLVLSSQQLYEVEKISDLVIFLRKGAPQYQEKQHATPTEQDAVIYEIESEAPREIVLNTFEGAGLDKISYNGGVYILHFKSGTRNKDVYEAIGKHDLPLNYIRNISFSSRRFFIQ